MMIINTPTTRSSQARRDLNAREMFGSSGAGLGVRRRGGRGAGRFGPDASSAAAIQGVENVDLMSIGEILPPCLAAGSCWGNVCKREFKHAGGRRLNADIIADAMSAYPNDGPIGFHHE